MEKVHDPYASKRVRTYEAVLDDGPEGAVHSQIKNGSIRERLRWEGACKRRRFVVANEDIMKATEGNEY